MSATLVSSGVDASKLIHLQPLLQIIAQFRACQQPPAAQTFTVNGLT